MVWIFVLLVIVDFLSKKENSMQHKVLVIETLIPKMIKQELTTLMKVKPSIGTTKIIDLFVVGFGVDNNFIDRF